ncbi:type VII secretion-associated serine protease mycosin [Streptomyces sp. NPDC056632]|uniref:type VII secretion-associated serine protease mycosin n=1 Tax=Streptomyces sp. NPDC056632 TaxID=3345884 RepID=UPI003673D081
MGGGPRWAAAIGAAALALAVLLQGPAVAAPALSPAAPTPQCAPAAKQTVPDLPWPQARLELERVWAVTRGAGQIVAVIDSGVDASVPQLQGYVLRGADVIGNSGRGDTDCVGHGTFVAGIIAAQPKGALRFVGVAPEAKILPIRQTTDGRDGSANSMAKAIVTAVDAGAHVINISANSTGPSKALKEAVAYAVSKNVLIVAAVGNQNRDEGPGGPAYPASYPDVLGVAAVGRDDQPASFSRQGGFVDIAAPGVDIISLGRAGPGYVLDQGTSFAAPFVAGAAALVRAYRPELTVRQIIRRLQSTADQPATTVPDPQVGWGIVNPFKAVTAIVPGERPTDRDGAGGDPEKPVTAITPATVPPGDGATSAAGEQSDSRVPLIIGIGVVVALFALGVIAARSVTRRR